MKRTPILAAALVLFGLGTHPAQAAPPLQIAHLSGNAGEIDPCG